ncbi:MAG: DUF1926 domain-containing protein [Pirellulaceae bacterium]|nr:DUF1926 domain-containing protein [Pirellulaceae bacterium]
MQYPVDLCLVLHNHQPVGNFDSVFAQAYDDSYLPFLEVFENFPSLTISLHTSGSLLKWLQKNRPEYISRLCSLVEEGRIEIIGGGFYEPILTMLSSIDRRGQIKEYKKHLESTFKTEVRGLWLAERVWEQNLTEDLSESGVDYLILDDFHFRSAGLAEEALDGYYLTEENSKTVKVFPGSEPLRYAIPFAEPHVTIDHLRELSLRPHPTLAVFADDGEKFGTWPKTKQHVYDNRWLERFFTALHENRSWLQTTTLKKVAENFSSKGTIYLPDASYREMTEWALPTDEGEQLEKFREQQKTIPFLQNNRHRLRGGYWRNFKIKYPESSEMYARMQEVSLLLQKLLCNKGVISNVSHYQQLKTAQDHLYQAQCNCGYWHGAFGGVYLPHLRNSVYSHLIAADKILARVENRQRLSICLGDYNFDQRQEVKIENDHFALYVAPAEGGHWYEWDLKAIDHNLLATLDRRPEVYHEKIREFSNDNQTDDVASIHDRVVCKEENLDSYLQYDRYRRKGMVDYFLPNGTTLDRITTGEVVPELTFITNEYQVDQRCDEGKVQLLMTTTAPAVSLQGNRHTIGLTKGVTLYESSSKIEVTYLLENLPGDESFHFGSEYNFAGLPADLDNRSFYSGTGEKLGHLGTKLDLAGQQNFSFTDDWLGVTVDWESSLPTNLWTYPIRSVNQSENGFELVHQSFVFFPHWKVIGGDDNCWSVAMAYDVSTKSKLKN